MIIDFHTHIVSPEMKDKRENYVSDPLFASFYSSPKVKLATADDLLDRMDKDEVDFSVALNIGWSSQKLCVESNDYLMESVAKFPRRLAGFGTVCLGPGESGIREIERCANGGLRGVGEMRLDRSLFEAASSGVLGEFIQAIISSGMVLLVHSSEPVGHQYPGKGDTTPDLLYSLITRFPELKLVCAHWGGGLPLYGLMPEVKEACRNVLFDTAASPYLYSPEIYRQVVRVLGAQSILFGTDYPLLTPARLLREIRALSLPAEEETSILSLNALRLLGLSAENMGG